MKAKFNTGKNLTKIVSAGMACCMLFSTGVIAACDNGETNTTRKYDEEKTSVIFSIGELDGVFNPFFSTSAYDGEIAGMTQISMLTADEKGKVAYGADEPVMTLDLKQTMYKGDQVTTIGTEATSTVYEFLIKNGVKDSTGADITIKDVLFNIYAYLDPLYNGSSTMYSTKIVGLQEYRTGSYSQDELDTAVRNRASGMMYTLVEYAKYKSGDKNHSFNPSQYPEATQEKYVEQLYKYIDEMAEEDWTSAKGGVEDANKSYILVDIDDYQTNKINPKTYDITEPWEVFFINEGLARNVEVNGKYKTEDKPATATEEAQAPRFYMLLDEDKSDEIAGLDKDKSLEKQKEICMNAMDGFKSYSQVQSMLFGSSVQDKMFSYFKDIAISQIGDSGASSVSGITTYKLAAGSKFNGVEYAMEHDVLRIEIEKIDPKAVWNFAFTVAPMHYYSNAEQIALYDGVDHFGVAKKDQPFRDNALKNPDKIGLPVGGGVYMASTENGGRATNKSQFKSNNVVYFERNPYFYTLGLDSPTATAEDLARENDNSKPIHNAYIKNIRYQVINSSSILDAMIAEQIDYSSEISAKQTNINALNGVKDKLSYVLQENNGYGYVGVNPKYVPDIEVRRLIMLSMERDLITQNYYTDGLGSIIQRSMSKCSWAYPDNASVYYTMQSLLDHYKKVDEYKTNAAKLKLSDYVDGQGNAVNVRDFIKDVLTKVLGYSMQGDCLAKKLADGKTYKLDYTFTIAGDTKDHPAYLMFATAAEDLNYAGMKIAVKTDAWALSSLSNGSLAVWAAAWSSSVDPDMYQVYHKNSQATSVNNWGYSVILSDSTGLYKTEQGIINELSEWIDEGRSYLEDEERELPYEEALDLVMELAVELPTYQRNNLLVYNSNKIDPASLIAEGKVTAYRGLIDKIWELRLR